MQYYKITIEPESSFGTELQSDTNLWTFLLVI